MTTTTTQTTESVSVYGTAILGIVIAIVVLAMYKLKSLVKK